jgi:hypothetical protein
MTEEECGYGSYCYRKKSLSELEQNDGLCNECATMIDDEDMEDDE